MATFGWRHSNKAQARLPPDANACTGRHPAATRRQGNRGDYQRLIALGLGSSMAGARRREQPKIAAGAVSKVLGGASGHAEHVGHRRGCQRARQ